MGGKSDGTVAAETPKDIVTLSPIGSQLDTKSATFDESKDKEKSIEKKRLGTRGLRIPLASNTSTTKDIQL